LLASFVDKGRLHMFISRPTLQRNNINNTKMPEQALTWFPSNGRRTRERSRKSWTAL